MTLSSSKSILFPIINILASGLLCILISFNHNSISSKDLLSVIEYTIIAKAEFL